MVVEAVVHEQHVCPRCGWRIDDALTSDEAAELLGCTKMTVINYLRAGKLPGAVKAPGPGGWKWLIPRESVEALTRP